MKDLLIVSKISQPIQEQMAENTLSAHTCNECWVTTLIICLTVLAAIGIVCYCSYKIVRGTNAHKVATNVSEFEQKEQSKANETERKRCERQDEFVLSYANKALKDNKTPKDIADGYIKLKKMFLSSSEKTSTNNSEKDEQR
jgi:hypothetical protein